MNYLRLFEEFNLKSTLETKSYNIENAVFKSSNSLKTKEFKKYFPSLKIEEGEDLDEVMGTKEDVIVYKSLDSGPGVIVEDTVLIANGEEIVDIRWRMNELKVGDKAIWVVSLGFNDGEYIHIFRGTTKGEIRSNDTGYGFGSNFYPDGIDKPIGSIENDIYYYSARKVAIENLKNKNPLYVIKVDDIPEWKGEYQH